ncbi:hypothetical protein FCM35_KLT07695 [Carex littledalei]|uniref:Uncharacterized protein n=1 Tax=Carex littledalei TaxID=544730 RepID=A0A833QUE3_9POAL|nr:hypothetical protein FCM35_KLT07695 [Carex littledalei]
MATPSSLSLKWGPDTSFAGLPATAQRARKYKSTWSPDLPLHQPQLLVRPLQLHHHQVAPPQIRPPPVSRLVPGLTTYRLGFSSI